MSLKVNLKQIVGQINGMHAMMMAKKSEQAFYRLLWHGKAIQNGPHRSRAQKVGSASKTLYARLQATRTANVTFAHKKAVNLLYGVA